MPNKAKEGELRQFDNDMDRNKLNELLIKANEGQFMTKDEELFLGRVIYDSHPWDYPTKAGGDEYLPANSYSKPTQRQIRNAMTAKTILATANKRLVLKQAMKYYELMKGHIPLDEVQMNGFKGMAIALNKYDYRRGFKFSSYLTWFVFRDVHRDSHGLARTINVPASDVKKFAEIAKRLDLGDTLEDILPDFNMTLTDYNMLANADKTCASLDMTVASSDHGSSTLLDVCQETVYENAEEKPASIESMMENEELMRDLSLSIAALPPSQKELISKLYSADIVINGKPRPVSDTRCREELGWSKNDYNETKKKALENLRNMMDGWKDCIEY